jgi:outer membrane protein assembly factor BamB
MKSISLLPIFLIFLISCSNHNPWNQYLGPGRNAAVSDEKILTSWGEKGPKEIWSLPVGEGYGGASIFKDEVFILDREKGLSDILRCIDLESGKELWRYSYEAEGELPYPGSRAVPTVDKKHVWSVGPHGHLYCFDKTTRQPAWNLDLQEEFQSELPNWGFSQSPLICRDLVIVAPQGEKAGVAAFHKTTGKPAWKSRPLSGYNFHVSPTLANFGGRDQVIVISPYHRNDSTRTHEVVSFDADTGNELWKYEGLRSFATITPATVIDQTRLFLTDCSYDGGYDPVSVMLEITREGDIFTVEELFKNTEVGSKMHPAVLFENHLYLNHTSDLFRMTCLNLEGEEVWDSESAPGFELGALILVNGMIINQNGKNGDIHLIKPSPGGYMEAGKASFFDSKRSQAWAPLAFSRGKLVIRDLEKLVCIDLQQYAD